MFRRFIYVVLVCLLLMGNTVVFGEDVNVFEDMPQDWSTHALTNAVNNGLLMGAKGKILPNEEISRAEMATILNRSFRAYEKASIDKFKDVSPRDWYYDEMAKSVQMKTLQGHKDSLNPLEPITREEAFVAMSRAFRIDNKNVKLEGYSDVGNISPWAADGVYAMIESGYVKGHRDKINPKGRITRAEFAQLMDNMVKSYISTPGIYESDMKGNIMVNVPGVIFKGISIDGDLILGDGVRDGDIILDDVKVSGNVIVRGGGENSIIIAGGTNLDNIVVSRVDGAVGIKVEKGSYVNKVIVVDGKDRVVLLGDIGEVELKARDVPVSHKLKL